MKVVNRSKNYIVVDITNADNEYVCDAIHYVCNTAEEALGWIALNKGGKQQTGVFAYGNYVTITQDNGKVSEFAVLKPEY